MPYAIQVGGVIDMGRRREHISSYMVMDQLAIVEIDCEVCRAVPMIVSINIVRMIAMMHVNGIRPGKLLMARLMRTPSHARHKQRAKKQ